MEASAAEACEAADSEVASGTRPNRAGMRERPLMSRPGEQTTVALAACVAVGGAWYLIGKVPGVFIAFALFFVPICAFPFELCLGFVVLSHFRIPEVFPALHSFRLPELAALSALAALSWHLWGTKRIRTYWCFELTLISMFFALVTVGVATAISRPLAFEFWSGYYVKVLVMTFAITWLATGPRHFATSNYVFTAAGLVVGGVALWNKVNGIGLVEGTRVTIGRELGSILGDPNDLALVLLFPTSFALGLALTRGIPIAGRLFGGASCIVLMLAIVATQSRGGLMGMMAVIIPSASRRIKSKLLIVVLMAMAGAALFFAAAIGERATVGDVHNLDESSMGRLAAWGAAINMAVHRPLTGIGINNFSDQFYFFTNEWIGHGIAAHSVWFQVLGETGFIGLAIYLSMIGVTGIKLLDACKQLRNCDAAPAVQVMAVALVGGMAGFCVSGTFLSQAYSWPIYVQLALSIAVSRYAFANTDARSRPVATDAALATAAPRNFREYSRGHDE